MKGKVVYVRRGQGDGPVRRGDIVDGYVLGDELEVARVEVSPSAGEVDPEPHVTAVQMSKFVTAACEDREPLRTMRCKCKWGARLADLYDVEGKIWCQIRAERAPRPVRHEPTDAPQAWPLHEHDGGNPCTIPTACPRCSTRWIVAITSKGTRLHRVERTEYAVRVR